MLIKTEILNTRISDLFQHEFGDASHCDMSKVGDLNFGFLLNEENLEKFYTLVAYIRHNKINIFINNMASETYYENSDNSFCMPIKYRLIQRKGENYIEALLKDRVLESVDLSLVQYPDISFLKKDNIDYGILTAEVREDHINTVLYNAMCEKNMIHNYFFDKGMSFTFSNLSQTDTNNKYFNLLSKPKKYLLEQVLFMKFYIETSKDLICTRIISNNNSELQNIYNKIVELQII